MEIVSECLPEIRYFLNLSKSQSKKYLAEASPKFIECLYQITINLLYGHKVKNGLTLNAHHVKQLKRHKKTFLKLVKTKRPSHQRKLLQKGGSSIALLSVLASVISSLASVLK